MSNVSKPTEVNEVTVHVHAASPIGDQPQPYLMLIAAKSIDVQHEYPLATLADVYATEGITIASALCRTLPQGTTHQVLIALLQRQVTLLMPAAGWPSAARTCAVCSKPIGDCVCGDAEDPAPEPVRRHECDPPMDAKSGTKWTCRTCGKKYILGGGAWDPFDAADAKISVKAPARAETADEAMLRDQRQAQARSDAEEATAAFRAPAKPAADPRGGPSPPSRAHTCWCGEEWVAGAGCAHGRMPPTRVLVAFIERVATFRPSGLEGRIENDVAGLRHDAEKLIDHVRAGKAQGTAPADDRRALFEKAFRAGTNADPRLVFEDALADALKKAGLA